jgi:tRNA 2-thiocytidine biosynthesis protein TtcA
MKTKTRDIVEATPRRELSLIDDMDRVFESFFNRGWLRPFREMWPEWARLEEGLELRTPRVDVTNPRSPCCASVGRAIADFRMIGEGDRILLGVSGGKDSLSLLHILRHLQTYAPVRFELAVLTVDPQVPGFDPEHAQGLLRPLGVPWHYEQQPLMEQAQEHMDGDSFCAYCSRMKRGIMYRICREQGYGVLALAQHLDDLAESLLMSLFHGGQLRTMKAHYLNDEGDVRIIRPLVYCRERQTADYAERAGCRWSRTPAPPASPCPPAAST